jgi:hypothetical protein
MSPSGSEAELHVKNTFQTLQLASADTDPRLVLAALQYLEAR